MTDFAETMRKLAALAADLPADAVEAERQRHVLDQTISGLAAKCHADLSEGLEEIAAFMADRPPFVAMMCCIIASENLTMPTAGIPFCEVRDAMQRYAAAFCAEARRRHLRW